MWASDLEGWPSFGVCCLSTLLQKNDFRLAFEFSGKKIGNHSGIGLIISVLSIVSRNNSMSNLGVSNSTSTNWGNQDCTARGATSVTVIIVVLSGIGVCFYVRNRIFHACAFLKLQIFDSAFQQLV